MNLFSKRDIKNLLKKEQIKPLKQLGQNFLIDKGVAKKIIEAANLKPKDIVLEIGPGIGTLTQELAKKVKKVIAIEKDRKMCKVLKKLLDCWNVRNVKIVNDDILKLNTRYQIQNTRYKIVANLPYYIVSPVIRQFLEQSDVACPILMVLMVQKEVGQRICAKPGKMSILAISVQLYANSEIISYVSKKSFWPQPKVDGAILKIVPRQFRVPVSRRFRERFFKIVKAGFSQPRKQLAKNLATVLKIDKNEVKEWLLKNKIQPSQRAETLSIKDWINLTTI